MDAKGRKPETLAAQAMGWVDETTRAVSPPIHTSSTYLRDPDNQYRSGRAYARADNPAFDQAEALLAALENGAQAALFSSGMAAATSVFLALAPGDHVLAPKVMYWSLRNWLAGFATQWGLEVDLIDMGDPAAVRAAVRPGKTRLVWIETPANPLWTVTDIAATAEIAKSAGAMLAVDSTVATPVLTRPLELGADLVMHSATKYLNGHSDLVAGALATREDNAFWQRIKAMRAQLGGTMGSFEAWLLLRGMRTLFLRVNAASRSAQRIAEHFSGHPQLAEVLYPGLPSSASHAVAAKQMQGGFGGMLSIRARGGEAAAIATAAKVALWKRATSLGGVESLVEHRASIEGANNMNDTAAVSRNLDRIRRYCLAAGLDGLTSKPGLVELAIHDYVNALAEQVEIGDIDSLYRYTVPMLPADGSCSVIDEMAPVPYDLTAILGGRCDVTTRRLALLERLVERAQEVTGANWLGIYQRRTSVSGMPVLVKLSYLGLPSRAEFPLTPEFARGSTNSTVGLSGRAMVIADASKHVETGGGFYACDPKVKSEACLPILDEAGEVAGIVDAEAEEKSFFGEERLACLAALCLVLPAVLP